MKGGKKEKEISQNDVTKKCKEKYHEKVAKRVESGCNGLITLTFTYVFMCILKF